MITRYSSSPNEPAGPESEKLMMIIIIIIWLLTLILISILRLTNNNNNDDNNNNNININININNNKDNNIGRRATWIGRRGQTEIIRRLRIAMNLHAVKIADYEFTYYLD